MFHLNDRFIRLDLYDSIIRIDLCDRLDHDFTYDAGIRYDPNT